MVWQSCIVVLTKLDLMNDWCYRFLLSLFNPKTYKKKTYEKSYYRNQLK